MVLYQIFSLFLFGVQIILPEILTRAAQFFILKSELNFYLRKNSRIVVHSHTESAIKSFEVYVQKGRRVEILLQENIDVALSILTERQHALTNFKFFDYTAKKLYSPQQTSYLKFLFVENEAIQHKIEGHLKNLREHSLDEMLKLSNSRRKLARFKVASVDHTQIVQEV